MDNEQGLEHQIATWNAQAANGEISYRELETRILQAAESLNKDFAEGVLTWEEYETQRAFLLLTDAVGQQWRLFTDDTWRRQTPEGEWQAGQPGFRPLQPPQPLSAPDDRSDRRPMVAVLLVVAVVFLGGGSLLVYNLLGPIPSTLTPSSPPPSVTRDSQITPSHTSNNTATRISNPSVTPAGATTSIETPSSIATPTPTLDTIPSTSTPISTTSNTPFPPVPMPTPYGVIAYPIFDEKIGTYNIYLRAWPDLNPIQVIPQAGQPAAQKSGAKLAYRSWAPGRQGILVMDLQSQDTSEATRIYEAMHPAWSLTGSIAFTANNQPDEKWHLYIDGQMVPIDGSLDGPAWLAPNRLTFHGCVTDGCGLFAANTDGSELLQLTSSNHDLNPVPSPAGNQVAFMSHRDNNWDIYLIAADGSQAQPTRLTTSPAADVLPAWSPDGHWITFVSDRSGQWAMWIMPAARGEPQHLFDMEGSPNGFVEDGPPSQAGWLQEQVSWYR